MTRAFVSPNSKCYRCLAKYSFHRTCSRVPRTIDDSTRNRLLYVQFSEYRIFLSNNTVCDTQQIVAWCGVTYFQCFRLSPAPKIHSNTMMIMKIFCLISLYSVSISVSCYQQFARLCAVLDLNLIIWHHKFMIHNTRKYTEKPLV